VRTNAVISLVLSPRRAFFLSKPNQLDDLAQRIENLRLDSLEKNRIKREGDLKRRREVWAELTNGDPDRKAIADLMTELKKAEIDFKPIYILVKNDQSTTPAGTYRVKLHNNAGTMPVTIEAGWQRLL